MGPGQSFILADDTQLLKPGQEYILFLFDVSSTDNEYAIEDGLRGAFLVESGTVSTICPNYSDPSAPTQADGTMSISDFEALITSVSNRPSQSASPSSAQRRRLFPADRRGR